MSGHITAELAEAEPAEQRLFSGPARPMSPAMRAMFKRVEYLQSVRGFEEWEHKAKSAGMSPIKPISSSRRYARPGSTPTA